MNKAIAYLKHTKENQVEGLPLGTYKFILNVKKKRHFFLNKDKIEFEVLDLNEYYDHRRLFVNDDPYATYIESEYLGLKHFGDIFYEKNILTFLPREEVKAFDYSFDYEIDLY